MSLSDLFTTANVEGKISCVSKGQAQPRTRLADYSRCFSIFFPAPWQEAFLKIVLRKSGGTLVPALTVAVSGQHTLMTSWWRIKLQNCIFLLSVPIAAADSAIIHSRTKWLQNATRSAFSCWVCAGVNDDVRYKKTKKQAYFFLLLEKALPPETL